MSDASGNTFSAALRFDAFGNRSATGGTDPYFSTEFQFGAASGYQSEYSSPTEPGVAMQYLGQRYYDPAVGRFITSDPAGGGNQYNYAGDNPQTLVYPSRYIAVTRV